MTQSFAIVVLFQAATSRAADPALTLAEPALARQLNQPVTLVWKGLELAAALDRLGDVQKIAVWIDRRVDPNARLEIAATDQPVTAALDALAADADADRGWTALRTVAYVGPRRAAAELATLSELARSAAAKAPPEIRRKWLTAAPWKFPRMSEPSALFEATLAEMGVERRGGATIPHDVWDASFLPAIAPIDRVVLILSGFDLALEMSRDGRFVRAVPIKRPVQLTRNYPFSESLEGKLTALSDEDDAIRVRRKGRRVEVSGRWEVHRRLRDGVAGRSPDAPLESNPPRPRGEQRFTLRIASKPVGAVLDQLAAQLQLSIVWDSQLTAANPSAGDALVSCDVREVDLEGLLTALLEPAGLAFERQGQTVTIRAR